MEARACASSKAGAAASHQVASCHGAGVSRIDEVFSYWNAHPLFSHEVAGIGSADYFAEIDAIKRNDVERFAIGYWEFERAAGKKVLDIGCGPGWLAVQYAKAGAEVSAIDLTEKAIELTRAHLQQYGLMANVEMGNAESLSFKDGTFDLVVSSGVLHHTPDTQQAFREAFRVLRPGGTGKITLYRLGVLHSPVVFPLTRAAMRMLAVKHPGADMSRTATDVQDFVRQYDGAGNPIGSAKTNAEWGIDLRNAGFTVSGVENHFFPRRFLPAASLVPAWLHRVLDAGLGTMVYFSLRKPVP
jgi:ubiquinone/menaquinone biosynthesis C-methylase UbiE